VLFLYRPRQTYMPFRRPRPRTDQDLYNYQLQQAFSATRQVPQYAPADADAAPAPADDLARLRELAKLHDSGVLTDAEFSAAKAKLLGLAEDAT
jgi:Short C-terminal domain